MRKKLGDFLVLAFMVFLMMLPGAILDFIYYLRNICFPAGKIVNWARAFFQPLGITYTAAFGILNSNVGVLMTMVSLFLTMNINLAERSEKKIYGITYKEIQNVDTNPTYRNMKRISYIAPVLMLIILNLHCCIMGYLLFVYCYGFLIYHYYLHASSFSRKTLREKVARKLLSYLPVHEQWRADDIQQFDMYLYEVGKSIENEGNWQGVAAVYENLVEFSKPYPAMHKVTIYSHFYRVVYWNQKNPNFMAVFLLWKMWLDKLDNWIGENEELSEDEWALFWGMMQVVVSDASEEQLKQFFDAFLQFKNRSRSTIQMDGKRLSNRVLHEQSCAILILLERRMRTSPFQNEELLTYVKALFAQGERIFAEENVSAFQVICSFYAEDSAQQEEISNIIHDFTEDYKNQSARSMIRNIIMLP